MRLAAWAVRRRGGVLALAGLVFAAAIPGLVSLRVENTPEQYFPSSGREREILSRFTERFGETTALRVVVEPAGADAMGSPEPNLADWEESLSHLEGVDSVLGPHTLEKALASLDEGSGDDPAPSAHGGALSEAAGFDGNDGSRSFLLLVKPADEALVLARAEHLIQTFAPPLRSRIEVVGLARLARALDDSGHEVLRRSLPVLALLSAVLLTAIFRDRRGVLAPLGFVGLALGIVLGLLGAVGQPLHLMLGILPPLLWVLALATAVHLLTRTRQLAREGHEHPIELAYAEKGAAILWTTLASAAGFGSLAWSPVEPVRDLGVWSAFGLAVVGGLAFTVLPALLAALAAPPRKSAPGRSIETALHDLGCRVAEGSARRFRRVLFAATALGLLALAGFPRLSTQSNALLYLPRGNATRQAIERLDRAGFGSSAVEISVGLAPESGPSPASSPSSAGEAATFDSGAGINRLAWWALRLREESGALRVLGAGDWVEEALRRDATGRSAMGGAAPRQQALERLRETESGRRALRAWLAADGRHARFTLFAANGGLEEFDGLVARARQIIAEDCPDCEVEATGRYALLLSTQRLLLRTLARSFLVTIAVVSVILYLLLRRFRLTLLALVPNVLPVLVVFGAMGWLGWSLDIATVMVASTTLGLALDDTIHTLVHFRRRVLEVDAFRALLDTVETNAAAYSVTGIILFLGFAAIAVSSFTPIRQFGLLSALSIALAVGADFLLVPALLGGAPNEVVAPKPASLGSGR